jgi:hypothetical protein
VATRALLTRVAAKTPAMPARPKAAPTHAGPVRSFEPGRAAVRSTGVIDIGGRVATDGRSTATSMEAMPRTAALPLPPHATTVTTGRFDWTPAASKRTRKSTLGRGGSTTMKSLRASPTNSSTLESGEGDEARPRTVTRPAKVAPGVGSVMFTTPASGPVVGQVLGIAPAGSAKDARAGSRRMSRRRANTSPDASDR